MTSCNKEGVPRKFKPCEVLDEEVTWSYLNLA